MAPWWISHAWCGEGVCMVEGSCAWLPLCLRLELDQHTDPGMPRMDEYERDGMDCVGVE